MAINSKNKGNRGEREVAKFMKEWTGYEFTRVPQSGGLRWKSRENIAGDIICSDPKHERYCRLSIEVKFPSEVAFEHLLLHTIGKSTDKVNHYWNQCSSDANAVNKVPILFIHRNGMKKGTFFVVLDSMVASKMIINQPDVIFDYGIMDYIKSTSKAGVFGLTIMNSEDLKKFDYSKLHKKIFKPLCKSNGEG